MRTIAVIDCGSNTFHLLVVRVAREGKVWGGVAKDKEVLRFAERDEAGDLSPLAMSLGLEVLARFLRAAQAHGAEHIVAVATSAIREARNGEAFLARAEREVGLAIRAISGQEEARLIHLGVTGFHDFEDDQAAIVDIGGGSSELMVGNAARLLFNHSVPLGAVDLTRRILGADPIPPERFEALDRDVDVAMRPITAEMRRLGFTRLLGTSGTIKTLAAIEAARLGVKLTAGYTLSYAGLVDIEQSLRGMTTPQRLSVPGMATRRADIIVAGAAVLRTVMTQLGAETLTVCDRALREGLILEALRGANVPS